MILTCPKCATRFLVDDSAVRAGGRKVRCSVCGEEWRVDPGAEATEDLRPALAPVADSLATDAVSPAEIEVLADSDADTAATSVVGAEPLSLAPRRAAPPPANETSIVSPIGARARLPAKAAPRSRLGASWGLVVLVILAIVVTLFGFRREIVRVWPTAGGIYASLGIPTTPRPPVARPAT